MSTLCRHQETAEKDNCFLVTAPKNPLTEREVLFIRIDCFYNLLIFYIKEDVNDRPLLRT